MPKVKVPKKSTAIDMTAMCDVAFLLLTFFILTSQFKPNEPLSVDTPASIVKIKLPEVDVATITVGKGKIFFSVIGQEIRSQALEHMGERYGIKFSLDEKKRFAVAQSFGVAIHQMKNYISMSEDQRNKSGFQTGIPVDSADNQLYAWIIAARQATKQVNNTDLKIAIKGDQEEEYPTIKKVIDVLQRQNINKFSLITDLKTID